MSDATPKHPQVSRLALSAARARSSAQVGAQRASPTTAALHRITSARGCKRHKPSLPHDYMTLSLFSTESTCIHHHPSRRAMTDFEWSANFVERTQ